MKQRPSRAAVLGAVRYLLQLGVELENGADDEDRVRVLAAVVEKLERHREAREQLRRRVLVAELVPFILRRLASEEKGDTSRRITTARIVTWLRDRKIYVTNEEIDALLKQTPRHGALERSQQERLLDRLGSLVGVSQSAFQKLTIAMNAASDHAGPLGTENARACAASDEPPTKAALVGYVADALGLNDWDEASIAQLVAQDMDEARASTAPRLQHVRTEHVSDAGTPPRAPKPSGDKRRTSRPRRTKQKGR